MTLRLVGAAPASDPQLPEQISADYLRALIRWALIERASSLGHAVFRNAIEQHEDLAKLHRRWLDASEQERRGLLRDELHAAEEALPDVCSARNAWADLENARFAALDELNELQGDPALRCAIVQYARVVADLDAEAAR